MADIVKQSLDYGEVLRVIGQFIERERLSEVSILEYEKGWIIHGLTYKSTSQGFIRVVTDHLLSHDDIRRMQNYGAGQRHEQPKRRWGR